MQETAIFGTLMMLAVVFIMILAADAPGELQNIFDLLKQAGFVGLALIAPVGIYFFIKELT